MEKILVRSATKEDLPELASLLSQLTSIGTPDLDIISETVYSNIYVAYTNNKIVGTITLLVEPKIIHNAGKVGHIEDVVVHTKYRKKGIGKLLIDHVKIVAKEKECYKIILDCDEHNIGFYEKSGFKTKGVCMRFDIN
jgi:glucosamine-phosphate N-acetyltransferase